MNIYVYNTLTKKKELFVPKKPNHLGMYVCGPTVYSDAHLGHAKTAVAFDVIRKWFEYSGYNVRYVMNVTDVGHITTDSTDSGVDRINEKALIEKIEPMEIADTYFWNYFDDMNKLNVKKPNIVPRATGHISEQIEMVQKLIDNGLAYEVNGSVYFRVKSWSNYGKLSGRKIEEQEHGTREQIREEKEDPLDFALWKFAEPEHIMRWNSPWGEGFPGWHIECSAMSLKYLGEDFDIHGGGIDICFPHHESEIAQTEGIGSKFARYWIHSNMLNMNGEKMSKSKGNLITIRDFYKIHDPLILRYILIQSHYSSVTEITPEIADSAKSGLARLKETLIKLKRSIKNASPGKDVNLENALQSLKLKFYDAMNNNFNTPVALSIIFEISKEINLNLGNKDNKESLEKALHCFEEFAGKVLGLFQNESGTNQDISDSLISSLIKLRNDFRKEKNWEKSDEIRNKLNSLGIIIEDDKEQTNWKIS